jgi:hypothetical protein
VKAPHIVVAHCRPRGSIGNFRDVHLVTRADEGATREQILDAWIATHGERYELHHLQSWAPLPDAVEGKVTDAN